MDIGNGTTVHSQYVSRSSSVSTCSFADDNTFGPVIPNACRTFDFTLLFEQSFLSLAPSLLLVLFSCFRLRTLLGRDNKTLPSKLHSSKLFSSLCYACSQLACLVLWTLPSTQKTIVTLPTAIFAVFSAIAICLLSHFEHVKSIKPSTLLNVYLLFSALFDAVQLRTLWRISGYEALASLFSCGLAIKLTILTLEAWEKGALLTPLYRRLPPEARGGIYNISFFWWLNGLFMTGFKKVLAFDDLYSLDTELSSASLAERIRKSWDHSDHRRKHALLRTVFSCLKWQLLAPILPRLCMIGFTYSQPFMINRIITFVENDEDTESSKNIGYGLIGAAAIIYLGLAISKGRYQHRVYRSITAVRGVLSTLIYDKTLELHYSTLEDAAPVTLMSTDVDSIITSLQQMHDIWAGTCEAAIAMYLLSLSSGFGCVTPIVLAVAGAAGNSFWVGPQMRRRRPEWNAAIGTRIALVSSILGDMKSLKMLGLTDRLKALLQSQRVIELERSKAVRWMVIWLNVFANLMPVLSKPFVLATVALQARQDNKQPLTAAEAYTILTLISLAAEPLATVTAGIPGFMGGIGCFGRIQNYLECDTKSDDRLLDHARALTPSSSGVELQSLTPKGNARNDTDIGNLEQSSLGYSYEAAVLHNISTSFKAGSITMVIGPVGSGKTSMLLGLLGEIQSIKGFVRMNANMAYCQQSTWLPNASIRDIIIGNLPFDEVWYKRTVFSCGLDVDISRYTDYDNTLVGSRGLNLSGGQRQRLALARAIYARKTVVLLDDIFSALDAKTEQLVLERLFTSQGLLKQTGTTVILATHAVHQLHVADHVVVLGRDGSLVEQGSFSQLMSSGGYVKALAVNGKGKQQCEDEAVVSTTRDVVETPTIIPMAGALSDRSRVNGDLSVYKYYAKQIGLGYLMRFLILQFGHVSTASFPELWVQFWTADNGHRLDMYISVIFAVSAMSYALTFSAAWSLFIKIVPRSGFRLHSRLLSVVFAAPLGFFANTDAGVILNRFSQDMTIVDTQLPIAVLQLAYTAFGILWSAALIVYGAYYLGAFIPPVAVIVYGIQKFYLRTSRQLRLLDLEMKSPLFTHFTETQEGLVTIRAFQWQRMYLASFLQKLDASQRPYYLLFMIQQWLAFSLAMLVAGIAVMLVAFATQLKNQTSGAAVGIALLNVIDFSNTLASMISHWTQLETAIGAIARLKQLEADVISEDVSTESHVPPKSWPTSGAVVYKNVSGGYKADSPPILKNIDLSIASGEKVGICGRTGSGKSTLISLLFRLLPSTSGDTLVDDVDISTVPRQLVRSSIIAIPQEPYILAGSVRFNAAPHTASFSPETDDLNATDILRSDRFVSDAQIIAALEKVDLWGIVAARGGLSIAMSELGLSHGQKQLFCLARAILLRHTSRLLVLDEATSSVDKHTDELMRAVIEREFEAHTVISVAHRLSSLGGCDRVVVMDEGSIVEVGAPSVLKEMEGGWYKRLWDAQN